MFLKWNESLSTNIKWIDNQHKSFLQQMDDFLQDTITGKGRDEGVTVFY